MPTTPTTVEHQQQEKQLLSNHSDLLSAEEEARIPHRQHIHQHSFKGHVEEHFSRPELVRDCILGLSDGLTVPFALAAGLSSLGDSRIVIYGGIAELVSGAISMGLGGYLAAKSDADHYNTERQREAREVELYPDEEEEEIVEIFEQYGLDRESIEPMFVRFRENTEKFVDFMMKFELNLEMPDPNRSLISAATIGLSYLFGGLIPLLPYFLINDTTDALFSSIVVTSMTLLAFGYIKSIYLRPAQAVMGALQTLAIGGIAAGCSYLIVAFVNSVNDQNDTSAGGASVSFH
ncbi:VIT family-domain-containing protein [Phascolomyces articulosus]|uniref:VIT family-domain-containing protein n=1 Tax=Phascolomyces articulosus TaxID=60185 RepID=A0AAD5JV96_9FUNG|nr:VIT family-domain-containing protein [Phascolomyces articulosus]